MNKVRIAVLFVLGMPSAQGLAQLVAPPEPDRPLRLNVNASITHDNNLFRLSDVTNTQAAIGSSERSDNIYQIGAGGSYEFRQSRQKFILEGKVDDYKFQRFSNLDYVGYDARGEWKWQVGNFWDGTLGLGHRRFLAPFANVQANIKDLVDQDQIYGTANYQVYSRLRLTLDLNRYDTTHGDASQKIYDSAVDNAAFTVNWVTPALNTVGLQYRTADGRYDNKQLIFGSLVDNAYHESEWNVVTNWQITGVSTLRARLGYTRRSYDELSTRDFSGTTWRFTYLWQPTGKLGFEFATWREIGEYLSGSSNYVRITGTSVAPTWSLTPNVSLQGRIAYLSDAYLGDPGFAPGAPTRSDKERIYQISLLWSPFRRTNVTLSLEQGERTSNQETFSYDYRTLAAAVVYNF